MLDPYLLLQIVNLDFDPLLLVLVEFIVESNQLLSALQLVLLFAFLRRDLVPHLDDVEGGLDLLLFELRLQVDDLLLHLLGLAFLRFDIVDQVLDPRLHRLGFGHLADIQKLVLPERVLLYHLSTGIQTILQPIDLIFELDVF